MISAIVAYFFIGLFNTFAVFLIMASLLTISGILRVECLDILFRDNTPKKDLNKEEGFLYSLLNLGWLIGPLVAGFFMLKFNLGSVFFVAGFFFIISLILFSITHVKNISKPRKSYDVNYLKNIKDFFSNKDLHLPYLMATGIEVWWALVYIYVPLFMIRNNLSESSVALFFSLIIIPLVILENRVGSLSAKKGFRFFFAGGFLGLVLISFFLFLTSNIIYQLVLIVIGSIFVSFLEPIQDTFFFKQVASNDEEKFYPLFSSSADLGGFIGKFVVAAFLLFLPTRFAYAGMFFMMLFFVFMALKIPKNKK